MIAIEINQDQVNRLVMATHKAGRGFKREIAAAINAVGKKTKLDMGRDIRKTVNLKKAVVEKPLAIRASASENNLIAIVSLRKDRREGLQEFGARQDKRGVSYKIAVGGGRKRINGAFMGPKPGQLAPRLHGGVFKRAGEARKMTKGRRQGKIEQPIIKLLGVSPWGAYVKNNMSIVQVEAVSKELLKQMDRRINLNILRANGLVKG